MKVDRKRFVNNYVVFFVLLTLAFGGMFRNSFCSDSVNHILDPAGETPSFIANGRFLMALSNALLCRIGINPAAFSGAFCFIGVLLFSLSCSLLYEIFADVVIISSIFQRITFTCIIAMTLLNPLIIDQYFYPEVMIGYTLGMLSIVFALPQFINKKYLRGFLCAFISIMFYQSSIVVGIILFTGILFLMNKGKLSTHVFLHEIAVICVIGLSGVIDIVIVKIGVKLGLIGYVAKQTSFSGVGEIIAGCLKQWKKLMKDSLGTVPEYVPLLFCALCIIISVAEILRRKEYLSLLYAMKRYWSNVYEYHGQCFLIFSQWYSDELEKKGVSKRSDFIKWYGQI